MEGAFGTIYLITTRSSTISLYLELVIADQTDNRLILWTVTKGESMSSERDPQSKNNHQVPNDIEDVFQRFNDMAVGDIKRAFSGGAKVGAFILTFVAIDCLTTWYVGHDSKGKDLENFIEEFFPEKYKTLAKDFYRYLRCGLVHNYSTKTDKYALTDGCSAAHLKTSDGTIVLNWESFFSDFLAARDRYYEEVRQSTELQHLLRERIDKQGMLQVRQSSFSWLLDAHTGEISTIE